VEWSTTRVLVFGQHVEINELEHHKKWTVWQRKHLRVGARKNMQTVSQQKLLGALELTFGNLLHLSRRGLTSLEGRFLEEFEESLQVLVKIALVAFES
jgi:hypothetical protein